MSDSTERDTIIKQIAKGFALSEGVTITSRHEIEAEAIYSNMEKMGLQFSIKTEDHHHEK